MIGMNLIENEKECQKDCSVELCRIIGCLIVVGIHCWMNNFGVCNKNIGELFISCCLADGVAVFWLISGFFIYRNYNYKKILKRTMKTIIVPTILISVLMFYVINNYLINNRIGIEIHEKLDYLEVGKLLLTWNNPIQGLGHFWYIYVYILLMLISPIIYSFVTYLECKKNRQINFLVISFAFLFLNDLSNNQFGKFEHHAFAALIPAMIEMIWGYLLYKHKENLKKYRYVLLSVVGFLILNFLRMIIQFSRYQAIDDTSCYILYWYSTIGLLCGLCVVIFSFSAVKDIRCGILKNIICKFASYTFGVYLLHPIVNSFLEKYLIRQKISEILLDKYSGIYEKIMYMMCITLLVVSICIVIITAIRLFYKLFFAVIQRLNKKEVSRKCTII